MTFILISLCWKLIAWNYLGLWFVGDEVVRNFLQLFWRLVKFRCIGLLSGYHKRSALLGQWLFQLMFDAHSVKFGIFWDKIDTILGAKLGRLIIAQEMLGQWYLFIDLLLETDGIITDQLSFVFILIFVAIIMHHFRLIFCYSFTQINHTSSLT